MESTPGVGSTFFGAKVRPPLACAWSAAAGHDDGISPSPYRYSRIEMLSTACTVPLPVGIRAMVPRLYR